MGYKSRGQTSDEEVEETLEEQATEEAKKPSLAKKWWDLSAKPFWKKKEGQEAPKEPEKENDPLGVL